MEATFLFVMHNLENVTDNTTNSIAVCFSWWLIFTVSMVHKVNLNVLVKSITLKITDDIWHIWPGDDNNLCYEILNTIQSIFHFIGLINVSRTAFFIHSIHSQMFFSTFSAKKPTGVEP